MTGKIVLIPEYIDKFVGDFKSITTDLPKKSENYIGKHAKISQCTANYRYTLDDKGYLTLVDVALFCPHCGTRENYDLYCMKRDDVRIYKCVSCGNLFKAPSADKIGDDQ